MRCSPRADTTSQSSLSSIGVENIAAGFAGTALARLHVEPDQQGVHGDAICSVQFVLCIARQAARRAVGISGRLVRQPAPYLRMRGFPALAALPDKVVGFVPFFVTTALAGLPALLLLILVYRRDDAPGLIGLPAIAMFIMSGTPPAHDSPGSRRLGRVCLKICGRIKSPTCDGPDTPFGRAVRKRNLGQHSRARTSGRPRRAMARSGRQRRARSAHGRDRPRSRGGAASALPGVLRGDGGRSDAGNARGAARFRQIRSLLRSHAGDRPLAFRRRRPACGDRHLSHDPRKLCGEGRWLLYRGRIRPWRR